MRLGNHLFHARKKCGLSQEEVQEKIDWTSAWGKKYPVLRYTGKGVGRREGR